MTKVAAVRHSAQARGQAQRYATPSARAAPRQVTTCCAVDSCAECCSRARRSSCVRAGPVVHIVIRSEPHGRLDAELQVLPSSKERLCSWPPRQIASRFPDWQLGHLTALIITESLAGSMLAVPEASERLRGCRGDDRPDDAVRTRQDYRSRRPSKTMRPPRALCTLANQISLVVLH